MIRRLDLPTRTTKQSLVAHAFRFRAQFNLNEQLKNQRLTHSDKLNRCIRLISLIILHIDYIKIKVMQH